MNTGQNNTKAADGESRLDAMLALAGTPPAPRLDVIEAGALAGFDQLAGQSARVPTVRWLWTGGIAAALALAVAVPLIMTMRPAGPIPVTQPAMTELSDAPLSDADAFAAAMIGYSVDGDGEDADVAVDEMLEAL
jgi:hypothetical protein